MVEETTQNLKDALWPFFHVLVVAAPESGVVGQGGQLPWHYPLDLKFFRLVTEGSILWMGRSTLLSLPDLLPGRYHLVLSRSPEDIETSSWYAKVVAKHGLDQVRKRLRYFSSLEDLPKQIFEWQQQEPHLRDELRYPVFCVGGAQVFGQAWPKAHIILWTEVKKEYSGDRCLPPDFVAQLKVLKTHQESSEWKVLDLWDTEELRFYLIQSQASCVTLPWPLERLTQSLHKRWRWILEEGHKLPTKEALLKLEELSHVQ